MTDGCENCAAVLEQNHALQERYVAEVEKREAVVNRLADADKTISALRGQLTRLRTDSPKMADAEEVFRFWVQRLGKNARTTFGPKRQEKVIARLKEKSLTKDGDRKDDLKWAIRGCEALPFVGPQGRQATAKGGGRRHDDLELICRDETSVDRFMRYADDQADGAFRTFARALTLWAPAGVDVSSEAGQPFHVASPCPACEKEWALMAMPGRAWSGDLLWIECKSGCSPDEIKGRLRAPVLEVAAA